MLPLLRLPHIPDVLCRAATCNAFRAVCVHIRSARNESHAGCPVGRTHHRAAPPHRPAVLVQALLLVAPHAVYDRICSTRNGFRVGHPMDQTPRRVPLQLAVLAQVLLLVVEYAVAAAMSRSTLTSGTARGAAPLAAAIVHVRSTSIFCICICICIYLSVFAKPLLLHMALAD